MTEEEYENLKVGDSIYYYHDSIGMLNYEIYDIGYNGNIRSKENRIFSESNIIENYSISEEKAYLRYYIYNSSENSNRIQSLRKSLTKVETDQKMLDEKFGYLRDKFSEEFI